MLLIFRRGLDAKDFDRLETLVADLPYDAKWARRRDRLVLRIQRTTGEEESLQALVKDEAVAYVLRDPTADAAQPNRVSLPSQIIELNPIPPSAHRTKQNSRASLAAPASSFDHTLARWPSYSSCSSPCSSTNCR